MTVGEKVLNVRVEATWQRLHAEAGLAVYQCPSKIPDLNPLNNVGQMVESENMTT